MAHIIPSSTLFILHRRLNAHVLRSFLLSKPFFLVLALYTGTYTTANLLDTSASYVRDKPASTTTSGPAKFAATSEGNLSLASWFAANRRLTSRTKALSMSDDPMPIPLTAEACDMRGALGSVDVILINAKSVVPPPASTARTTRRHREQT